MTSRSLPLALLAVSLLASACNSSSRKAPTVPGESCADPQKGSRYAVCGHLTASLTPGSGARWSVVGSVDSNVGTSSSAAHKLSEGAFNVGH